MHRRLRRVGQVDADRRARQREIDRQLRTWTPRRIAGWAVVAAAVVMAVVHWVAHLGVRVLPMSMGWQDLAVGYPAAALLGVAGAILLGQVPPRGSRPGGTSRSRR